MDNDDILSFVLGSPDVDEDYTGPDDIEPGSIWDKLFKAITALVKKDGVRKSAILPGQSAASVMKNASENIYYDVSEFFYWYFDIDDWAGRYDFMQTQKKATILSPLRAAVKPVVEFNLKDMQEADLLPEGDMVEDLVDSVTDNLTRYILNWQDWYYDRKDEEEIEEHMFQKALYREIYVDSDYGDMTNIDNYLDSDVDDENEFGNHLEVEE